MRRRCPPTQVAPWICPFLSPELASRIRCFFRQPLARSSLQSIIACRLTDVSAVSQCYQPDPYRSAAIPHSAISLECTMTSGLIWYSIAPACHKHNPPALGGRPHVSQSCFFPLVFCSPSNEASSRQNLFSSKSWFPVRCRLRDVWQAMITCTWLLSCQKVTLGANVWEAMIISMCLLSCQKATLGANVWQAMITCMWLLPRHNEGPKTPQILIST